MCVCVCRLVKEVRRACLQFLGYARSPPEDTLKSRFDKPFPQLLKAYLAVPFLRELRQLLDWMASPTSLRLEDHMQFESMYTDLYLSRFEWLKDNVIPRKRTKFFKTTSGGSIFCVLMCVVFSLLFMLVVATAPSHSRVCPPFPRPAGWCCCCPSSSLAT